MTIQKHKIAVIVVFCLLAASASADAVNAIIQKHKQSKTQFAILAVDADSGRTLYQKDANTPLICASNMKVITSAAAMHYLGSDYTFKTKVGMLNGKDLVVIGGGDPLLGDPKHETQPGQSSEMLLNKIARTLQSANITSIENLIVDTSFFDNNRVHPSWPVDQLNQWYACEVSGLNFNNNCIRLVATRKGNRGVLTMQPANHYVQLVNQLKMISKGSSAVGAYRNSVPNKLIVKGKLNKEAGFDVAIENPAGLFASVLADKLKQSGIRVKGNVLQKYTKHEKGIRYLTTIETPISDVMKRCNTNSLGLAAEALVKTISAENTQGNINGEWPHGQALIGRYLKSLGISDEQYVLDDGSGLSRKNRLSPNTLVTVLKDIYDGPDADVFYSSLAVGGVDGTIYKYFRKAPYKGNILGKTGYISGVRSFSGICKSPRGDIIFCILTEKGNGNTRGCINAITEAFFDGKY
jgi:D-alanyl-D-alanine carboxypeptidase/D-alanyl-D-alanine-endopeptidase (penicillin-binding protein 4)